MVGVVVWALATSGGAATVVTVLGEAAAAVQVVAAVVAVVSPRVLSGVSLLRQRL